MKSNGEQVWHDGAIVVGVMKFVMTRQICKRDHFRQSNQAKEWGYNQEANSNMFYGKNSPAE